MKKSIVLIVTLCFICIFVQNEASSFFFKDNKEREFTKNQRETIDELKNKQNKEFNELLERQKLEKEEFIKKREQEKPIDEKVEEMQNENSIRAQAEIKEYKNEIRKARKAKTNVEIKSNEEDPLYITFAEVKPGKTEFLKLKDVDLNYRFKLHNQTPKIITSASIIWERGIPFSESQTLSREIKISDPIIPYEKRIVKYNETNSKRSGEIYKVKIAKVIFKDGTQWKNPD